MPPDTLLGKFLIAFPASIKDVFIFPIPLNICGIFKAKSATLRPPYIIPPTFSPATDFNPNSNPLNPLLLPFDILLYIFVPSSNKLFNANAPPKTAPTTTITGPPATKVTPAPITANAFNPKEIIFPASWCLSNQSVTDLYADPTLFEAEL
ncbi:hypothetical protein PMY73_17780 [Clostridium tertium]|uniref:hypothetical protein n=1 Tax=Clostridium tertium TaxID=1559 RepID=UPI00232C7CA2|nr:hypothetical protein [Clostridium tertium]MDB1953175.1 hypothetical protein [Clostridium tertium]